MEDRLNECKACCGGHSHEHEHNHHNHHNHDHSHSHDHSCCCSHDTEAIRNTDISENSSIPTKVYTIENLDCANCAAKMEEKIRAMSEVENAVITFATKELRLTAENADELMPKITSLCRQIEDEVTFVEKTSKKKASIQEEDDDSKKDLIAIIIGAVLFVGVEIFHEVSGVEAFPLPLIVILVAAYIVLGGEIVIGAVKNIFKGQIFDENFLMSIATLGAFAIKEYPEAVGVMLFFRIGEYFEHVAVKKSRSQIMEAVDLRPETVQIEKNGETFVVDAEDAAVGDIVVVRPGDRIPLDGIVVDGISRIDTSAVTGESVPVKVEKGSSVISGCVNTSGLIKIEVQKVLSDSMVSRILDSVENAAANKPKIDSFITRFARIYTPIVVFIALITAFVIPFITGQDYYKWIYTALSFLVMSCPCALVLSVPLAFFCGIGASSKKGILFKGGLSVEALANVKAVVMDKTGTITKGNFVVQSIENKGDLSKEEMLYYLAACESASSHPIAVSIVEEANKRNIEIKKADSIEEISGKGIKAVIDGKNVLCGNKKLLESFGVDINTEDMSENSSTEVLLAVDDKYMGYVTISDTIKAESKNAISNIKKQGILTAMLTGDTKLSAEKTASETGIEEVYSMLLPQDKLDILKKIRSKAGSVMFVGDGINDAPVLAGADVGAAMGSGADAAIEAADVVFMNSNMDAIPASIAVAKKTVSVAMQNVVFALAVKIAVMILGITGIYSNMWLAVFADTGVALICILNSVKIIYWGNRNIK